MKKLFLSIIFLALVSFAFQADAGTIRVRGYHNPRTGAYVMPYNKTAPNKTKLDNFSAKGNHNPFTGKKGYVNPYKLKY